MNDELSIKFNLTGADAALSYIWGEPASSKREYLRTGLIYLLLVGLMIYHKTPWHRGVIVLLAMAGFSYFASKITRWGLVRWGLRRELLKTSEVVARCEITFSEKGAAYRSEKTEGTFNWDELARVVNTPCGVVVQLNREEYGLFWIPLQVSPMNNRPRVLEMLRSRAKVYQEAQAPQDPVYRGEFERYIGVKGERPSV
ncbi:MAG: hypothetical protein PHV33_08530 [Elusimicrobiales bacterium]|nr:hypothetical protein [Elusimicrobiales bacterium]